MRRPFAAARRLYAPRCLNSAPARATAACSHARPPAPAGEGIDVGADFKLCMKAMARSLRASNSALPFSPLTLPACSLLPCSRATQCCPCVYYGQNMKRALLLNGYFHCLLFIIGMDLFWLVGSILRVRAALLAHEPPGGRAFEADVCAACSVLARRSARTRRCRRRRRRGRSTAPSARPRRRPARPRWRPSRTTMPAWTTPTPSRAGSFSSRWLSWPTPPSAATRCARSSASPVRGCCGACAC
jgi:hypothetical protein